jgi:glycosyltransferase involved in cell wall biosynthesis
MSSPLVSVVIPNYNYARFLPAALDSVLGQTHRSLDVIVIDDGSTDDSAKVLAGYNGRIRVLRQQNAGVSAARNAGILASRGEAIAFLDADDLWAADKIEAQLEHLADPQVGLVHCGIQYIDAQGDSLGVDVEGAEGHILIAHALLRKKTVRTGSSALVRRDCFDKVGLFDTGLTTAADWDMWRRLISSYAVAMVRRPLLKYRLHGAQMHRNVEVFERDVLRAVDSMFADPAAAAIMPYRRQCYANLYSTLSGAYLHQRRWRKSAECAVNSLRQRPDRFLINALGIPVRRARKLLQAQRLPF